MEFLRKNDLSSFSLIASCIIHVLLFVFIFILLTQPDNSRFFSPVASQVHQKSSPVIFRQPAPEPQKATTIQEKKEEAPIPTQKDVAKLPEPPIEQKITDEEIAQAELPGSASALPNKRPSLAKKMIKKTESLAKPLNATLQQEEQLNQINKQIISQEIAQESPKESFKKSLRSPATLLEATEIPAIFALPKPTQEISSETSRDSIQKEQQKAATSDQLRGQLRKNKLTLADLFKNLSSPLESLDSTDDSSQEGEIDGDMLVINQGDMKYYSFLQKFVTHMNQVFSFHGGPNQAKQWAQQGVFKRDINLTIIIDKTGNVLTAEVTQSSGHEPFDKLSLKIIQLASPFPPIPDRLGHQKVRVNLSSYL